MKKLEFTTGKGGFVVVDGSQPIDTEIAKLIFGSYWSIRFKDLTEEQASEIVDYTNFIGFAVYEDYHDGNKVLYTALDSLHSLIKSKGWYLENPLQFTKPTDDLSFYDNQEDMEKCIADWQQAESRTLNNPVIFKIK